MIKGDFNVSETASVAIQYITHITVHTLNDNVVEQQTQLPRHNYQLVSTVSSYDSQSRQAAKFEKDLSNN